MGGEYMRYKASISWAWKNIMQLGESNKYFKSKIEYLTGQIELQ